ncbi:MAG: Gfo/Idh/MocA family protein [Phyllobacterium sp.]
MAPIRIGIVGVGKIAHDQHLPSIEKNPGFELVAAVSRNASVDGVANFHTLEDMLENGPELDAVALCTPPSVRQEIALAALRKGKHVLLEKPPGATLSEIDDLIAIAESDGLSLFATWHSRFAAAVAPAKEWLMGKTIRSVDVEWKEDVRHWHPGQEWIWEPSGFGVFDPGINALSIMTEILPFPIFLTDAKLTFPENRHAPIAASLKFRDSTGVPVHAEFDWRQTGPQTWDIRVETDQGALLLQNGGALMSVDGAPVINASDTEYDGIYRRFAMLIHSGTSDIDLRPLRHVADAFMSGKHERSEAFVD